MDLIDCFGQSLDTASNRQYHWHSAHRGNRPFVILQYTLSGCGFVKYEGIEHPVPEGSAFICTVPEESEYYYKPTQSEDWTFSWLNFDGAFATHLWQKIREDYGCVISLKDRPQIRDAMDTLIASADSVEANDPYRRSAESYRFTMMVASDLRSPESTTSDIQQVIDRIRTHPEHPLAVKEMADQVGVSREHFTRLFIEQTGISPAKFRTQLQLERAAELLKKTRRSINEVAQLSGFNSASRFCHSFKAQFKTSPQAFRTKQGSNV